MKKILSLLLLLMVCGNFLLAQSPVDSITTGQGEIMKFFISEGDTVFISSIPPAYVRKKAPGTWKERKQWRKYYRLVHNFAKSYPYALVAREKIHEAERYIETRQLTGGDRERFVKSFEKDLFDTFEAPLRKLTITQGRILLRLIDREVGESSFEIIRNYRGGIAAGFWQGIAKLFGSDLKKPYDRKGEDKDIEKLVRIYQKGEFNALYYSIFGKLPPEPVIRPLIDYPQSLDF